MTHASRILDFLWAASPSGATNSRIRQSLGIVSHQTVYMVTQDLMRRKLVRAERHSHSWVFYAVADGQDAPSILPPILPASGVVSRPAGLTPLAFEALARQVMSRHYGVPLAPGAAPGVRKQFDLVSSDHQIVGDAKYFTLVGGVRLPPAKFSVIAEHAWLLEKTAAPFTFLVFGNDRNVPERWLERYGALAGGVTFYFLSDDGSLTRLR